MKKFATSLIAVTALLASTLWAQEKTPLETLRDTYARHSSTLRTKYNEQQSALDASLLPKLDRMEQASVDKGDLEGVLAVRKARESLNQAVQAKTLFAIPDNAGTPDLRQACADHRAERAAITAKEREETRTLAVKYAESLEKLKHKLVTENKIDEALDVQKVIDGLNIAPATPPPATPPPAPAQTIPAPPAQQPAAPQPQPAAPTPPKNIPDADRLLTTAELAANIQAYAGKTVRFYGPLVNLERENTRRVYLTFENGIRVRYEIPNLIPQFGSRYNNYDLNRVYIFNIGYVFLMEATLTQAPKADNPNSYRTFTIHGCNSMRARNYLKVSCQALCPDNVRQSNGCPHCKE